MNVSNLSFRFDYHNIHYLGIRTEFMINKIKIGNTEGRIQ